MKSADFLKPTLEQLGFLELRKDLHAGNIHLPAGLELPLLTERLRQSIQQNQTDFRTEDVVLGILLLFGLDESFENKDIYRSALVEIEAAKGSLVPFLVELAKSNPLHALIAGMGYQALELSDPRAELLTIEATNMAYQESGDKRYEQLAYDLLNRAAEHSDDWQVAYHLGYLLYNRDRFTDAILQFRTALGQNVPEEFIEEISGMVELSERKVDFTKGMNYLFSERAQEAIEVFESLRPDFPQWYSLHFYTGLAYRLEQHYSKALTLFYEALSMKQDDANLYNELSLCHMMLGEHDQALKHLELALQLDPKHPELLTNHGIVLYQLGDKDGAIKSLEQSLRLNPEDDLTRQWLDIAQGITNP